MRTTITDVIWLHRDVELPDRCPECDADLCDGSEGGITEYAWTTNTWYGHINADDSMEYDDSSSGGGDDSFASEYCCRQCGHHLADNAGEEHVHHGDDSHDVLVRALEHHVEVMRALVEEPGCDEESARELGAALRLLRVVTHNLRAGGPETLADLCDALNQNIPWGLLLKHGEIDLTALPTFGGDTPSDTQGIFSWDATHILIQGEQGWEIVPRAEVEG